MRVSWSAIEILRRKCNREKLQGFDTITDEDYPKLSEERLAKDFEMLVEDELIEISDEIARVSPLGQHIIDMLEKPEQYILAANTTNGTSVRIYIKDALYLCVVNVLGEDSGIDTFNMELLPTFELVIGSFIFALSPETNLYANVWQSISVTGISWDKERKESMELTIDGEMKNGMASYHYYESNEDDTNETDIANGAFEELINSVTKWMFKAILATEEGEGK